MGVRIRKKASSQDYYCFINHRGQRLAIRVGKDRRQAEQTRLAILRKIASGEFRLDKPSPPSELTGGPTLKEYFQTFKQTHLANSVRPSTADSYVGNFNLHILPVLGDLRLTEITPMSESNFPRTCSRSMGKRSKVFYDLPLQML